MSAGLTVGKGQLHGIPDELGNRMMMSHGSRLLLRAIRGDPPPVPKVSPEPPTIFTKAAKPRNLPYVPLSKRPAIVTPEAIRQIIDRVAEAFEIPSDWLTGGTRDTIAMLARAVAIRAIRDRTWENGEPRHSTMTIGRFFGRDHSTICHALGRFDYYCKQYPEIVPIYQALRGSAHG